MVTSPTHRDFKVISSPFEVVQEKLKSKPTSLVLPAGLKFKNLERFTTGEFGGDVWGPRYFSVPYNYPITSSSIEFPVNF